MYKEIVLSIDIDDEHSWKRALPTAVEYCHSFGARLHVVTVVPDYGMTLVGAYFPPDYEETILDQTHTRLDQLIRANVPDGVSTQLIVAHGTIYHEIIETAKNVHADLVIIASHRPRLADYLIGPNAARVVRHFNGSVLVVRN